MTDPIKRDPLLRLAELADGLGASASATDARALAARLAEGRFYVACVGQFKRGKSALLNALVDDHVLPTGVIPVTTVMTVLRHGPRRAARVCDEAGMWRDTDPDTIRLFVSDECNPDNTKGVTGVEVFLPCPLLATGMCLVDTPGLGSVHAANTQLTRAFVPQIDAALVVTGADPPLTGDELTLVESVNREVRDLIVVLNKADRVSAVERSAAAAFAQDLLEQRLGRPAGALYSVSALERMEHHGPQRDWDILVRALENLAHSGSGRLTHGARARGIARLSAHLLDRIEEDCGALWRPVADSERRLTALQKMVADADRALDDLSHLFSAEQLRLSRWVADERDAFVRTTLPLLSADMARATACLPRRWGPAFRQMAMAAAQDTVQARLDPWLEHEQSRTEELYAGITARFIELTNEFLERLASAGQPEFGRLPNRFDPHDGLRGSFRFVFLALLRVAQPSSPLRYLADAMLGIARAWRRIELDARAFANRLLEVNSTRVQSDLDERVRESRHLLEGEVRSLLSEVLILAEHALERARATGSGGARAVELTLQTLARTEDEVRAICATASTSRTLQPASFPTGAQAEDPDGT